MKRNAAYSLFKKSSLLINMRRLTQALFLLIFLWLFLQTESKGANELGYPVKIFLDAAPEVRGMRRYEQLGTEPAQQPEEVIRDLRARDERDRNRADSPLKPANDAILLDSTRLTLNEVVSAAEQIVAAKLNQH